MSSDRLRLFDYVEHVVTAIERIERYTEALDKASFISNALIQDAVIRNIEVIGEACNNIRKQFPNFVLKHPEVPFQSAYEMRNALSHGYHKIDLGIVWTTAREDLPALSRQFQALAIELKDTN